MIHQLSGADGLETAGVRSRPRHPGLAKAGYRLAGWLGEPLMARIGFHRVGSEFATKTIAAIRDRLQRGETVYIAGLGASGTHNKSTSVPGPPMFTPLSRNWTVPLGTPAPGATGATVAV